MANRRDFYYLQKVTEGELDDAFAQLEAADRNFALDFGLLGIFAGMSIAQHGAGDLTVDISGLGAAADPAGQRISIPSIQNLNLAVDSNNVTTAVSTPGNSKIVSVFAQFDRALSDPRIDGNSITVFFVRDETFKFKVVQGSEAVSPTPPALISDGVLLGDVTRAFGVNVVLTASIDLVNRRQDAFVVAGSPFTLRRGRIDDALSDIVTRYNQHVNGLADEHPASGVSYVSGPAWRNGDTNPGPTNVEAQLDKIVGDLASASTGTSGSEHLGSAAIVGSLGTIVAGTLLSQLQSLKLATTIEYAGGGAWADSTTNPAASVEAQFDKIISNLSSTSGAGANKIGIKARTTWLGGRTNVATDVGTAVDKIITDLASQTASDDGAERIGVAALSTWLGGRTNPAADVHAALDKIITDLAATTASDDGAERIGAAAASSSPDSLSSGSVSSQLASLLSIANARARIASAETISGAWIFSNSISTAGITATGTNSFTSITLTNVGSQITCASRTRSRCVTTFPQYDVTSGFTMIAQGYLSQTSTGATCYYPLNMPSNATVTQIQVYIKPAAGHASLTNVTQPTITLRSHDTTGTVVDIATIQDAQGTAGAYVAVHAIVLSSLSVSPANSTKRYFIVFSGEAGSAWLTGLQVMNCVVTYTVTQISDDV